MSLTFASRRWLAALDGAEDFAREFWIFGGYATKEVARVAL